jgi:NCK-associated protein 1
VTSASIYERKFAEKLTILNQRGKGIIIRVYNIKKSCLDVNTRPACLSDRALDSAIKHINKRFPNIETRDKSHLTAISSLQKDIMQHLPNYYLTFVDVMEFRDVTNEVITSVATAQFAFDITMNFDLTSALLDLVSTYASIMIMLGQVDDRRAIAGLYNLAHDMSRGSQDPSFPRLGQMFTEYDNALRKISEDFTPLSKVIVGAVMSLRPLYQRRNLPAFQLRTQGNLSASSNPGMMLQPMLSNELPCELLSLESMHRWILFGFVLCYNQLSLFPGASDLWKLALYDGFQLTLCRDEAIPVHGIFEKLLSDSKDKNDRRKASEAGDALNQALQNAGPFHRDRRRYLRTALLELYQLLSDSPGLCGPKALTVLQALGLARDEVLWLMKHILSPPPKGKHRPNMDDYVDNALPELLFYIVELKTLLRKHRLVVQKYYLCYLGGYDAQLMRDVVMRIMVCPEEESILMTSMVDTLARLQGQTMSEKSEFDFEALRLDWFRLQTLTSVAKAALSLKEKDHQDLAPTMNAVTVHSKLVDSFDEVMIEHSDMSFMCFFYRQFEAEFSRNLRHPSQLAFIISFPVICTEFLNCTSQFCPEERINIGERCVNSINHFLELIAKEVKNLLGALCDERTSLDDQLLPFRGAGHYLASHVKKEKKGGPKLTLPVVTPGAESARRTREDSLKYDSVLGHLVLICQSISSFPILSAWDHTFVPREYLVPNLEDLFMKRVFSMMRYNSDTHEIARPSEVLSRIQSYMSALRTLELYVTIDMTRVLTAVLLQETQHLDSKGEATLASSYTSWYTNTLLKRVAAGGICYSVSRKCFLSRTALPFKAEEYTDMNELQTLAEIIGPYGIRFMGEKLMEQVSGQVKEIKRLVMANQDTLLALHTNRDKPEIFQEVLRKMRNSEDLIARTIIVGIILAFRQLTLDALHSVLTYRVPFMLSSIADFKNNLPDKDSNVADHMAMAAGLPCEVDPLLLNAMKAHCDQGRDDYSLWSLFLVYVGVILPELAFRPDSVFLPSFEGHENNIHCLAIAVNALAGAIFYSYGKEHQRERMKEFLVFTSSRIMTLAKETEREKDTPKAREAIYLLLDLFVEESPFLSRDLLESCFPYGLLRDAYNSVYRKPQLSRKQQRDSDMPF